MNEGSSIIAVARIVSRRAVVAGGAVCFMFVGCATSAPQNGKNLAAAREAALTAGSGEFERELDRLLAAQAYKDVEQRVDGALTGQDSGLRLRTVNWLALKQSHGQTDSVFIGMLYAVGLVSEGANSQEPARAEWIRDAASAYYRTVLVILSEGSQCRDGVTTDARLGQVTFTLAPIQQLIQNLPSTDRDHAARAAYLLVILSFRDRYPDAWLCRPRGAGAPMFVPYNQWSVHRDAALRSFLETVLHDSKMPAFPPTPLQKSPDIIPLYG